MGTTDFLPCSAVWALRRGTVGAGDAILFPRSCILAALGWLVSARLLMAASVSTSAEVELFEQRPGDSSHSPTRVAEEGGSGTFVKTAFATYGSVTGRATAEAGYGSLRVSTDGAKQAQPPGALPEKGTGMAQATFQDSVTIGSSTHNGAKAVIYFTLGLEGFLENDRGEASLDVMGSTYFSVHRPTVGKLVSITPPSVQLPDGMEALVPTSQPFTYSMNSTYPKFFSVTLEGYRTVTLGTPFSLSASLLVYGETGLYGTRDAVSWDCNFGSSVYWGGIPKVTLQDGTVIPFTMTSDSGTDWRQSFVPLRLSGLAPIEGVAGQWSVTLQGAEPGLSYWLERSTDLQNWQDLTMVLATNAASAQFQFAAEDPAGAFFRVRRSE